MLLDVPCCCMYTVINDRGGLVLNSVTPVGYLYLCMCGGCLGLSSSRPMRLRARRLVEGCVYWIVWPNCLGHEEDRVRSYGVSLLYGRASRCTCLALSRMAVLVDGLAGSLYVGMYCPYMCQCAVVGLYGPR